MTGLLVQYRMKNQPTFVLYYNYCHISLLQLLSLIVLNIKQKQKQ